MGGLGDQVIMNPDASGYIGNAVHGLIIWPNIQQVYPGVLRILPG